MEIDPTGLLPYQPAAATALLRSLNRCGGALDASDMGVGKTAHAVAVLRALDVASLVVCPKVSKPGWMKMGAHLGTEFDVENYEALRTGKTPFGWWENPLPKVRKGKLFCEVCKQEVIPDLPLPCPYHPLGVHCVGKIKNHAHNYGKFHWHPNIKCLVFDEAHRCAALNSLQADMLIAAKRQRIKTLALSATIADSPLHFRALGYLLGLHNLVDVRDSNAAPGFYGWAFRNGCRRIPFRGLLFAVGQEKKQAVLRSLHDSLFPAKGCRVQISELGDAFPECQITAELYDTGAAGKIDKLYAEMDEALAALDKRKELNAVTPLTAILQQREQIELLMVPVFVELAQDAVAEGRHVAIFVNFRSTVEELCKRLKTQCRVDGSQVGAAGARRRQECLDAFQRDDEPILVATAAAGGVALDAHDVRGQFPRLGLVSLGYSAREVRQVFGRLRRSGGKSKAIYRCVLAAGTVQEKVHKCVAPKLDRLDTLNDGDLMASNLELTKFSEMCEDKI